MADLRLVTKKTKNKNNVVPVNPIQMTTSLKRLYKAKNIVLVIEGKNGVHAFHTMRRRSSFINLLDEILVEFERLEDGNE